MIRDTSAQDRALAPQPLWRRRRAQVLAAVGGGVALALAAWAWPGLTRGLQAGQSVSQARLALAEVERGPLTRDVAGEGKVVAAVSPTLYAGSAGSLSLLVQAGDPVKQGQPLVRIASPELNARLAQERSNADALHSEALRAEADARQQRAIAQGQLETAAIAHKAAQNELARQTQAFDAGATARSQVDQARDAVERAQVALKQAQELSTLKDDAMRFELQAKRQAFERQQLLVKDIERQSGELTVRSPVDGQVGQLFVADRMSVAKDARLLTIIDLSQLEVQMQVAESFARELQPGMPGEISGNSQRWAGRVSSVSPEVVNGEVAARLRFDGAVPEQLRQNQRLSVRVLLDRRDNVLSVARGSFVDEGGGRTAYVLRDGIAEKRAIKLGAQSLAKVEVLEGLQPGERVVISGADHFRGAERVVITP
ncbi:efflux RND transporter periplasmic adaptor subunit [Ideonella sp.]|uniref:efflux RND transporter periplasmic adaptor subunit n=1 Tax=Ideonella sp. TaxID=1929293 RepID=UPI002B47F218|nr:efflux RND transporter periplasmic adaptor subunit [Ideonella sp.]HJV68615.1 efflux RND transporter periplasmic adaptor subunit [Ideonella sp.]